MEKVKVTKEVAVAIEMYIDDCVTVLKRPLEDAKAVLVAEHYGQDWRKYEIGQYVALNDITTNELMTAMVVGYEVEKTPEEVVKTLYDACYPSAIGDSYDDGVISGITTVLNAYGIRIEGVNT